MRFCVVRFENEASARLCVASNDGLAALDAPPSLRRALEQIGPEALLDRARKPLTDPQPADRVASWFPPVPDPWTFRDFYAFEQHVKTCRARRGQQMVPQWYEIPVFYFSNPCTMVGHLQPVRRPPGSAELDFELEIACVIARAVPDVTADEAEDAIFGYMILNDLSARDLQRQEMACMLGPAKGKDFATATGPFLVTPDELEELRVGPGRYDLAMTARRNGREISRGNMSALSHDFTRMIERASRGVTLQPGDVIGSGTVGTGCILELGTDNVGGWLKPGDDIELSIDRLGTLTTPIV